MSAKSRRRRERRAADSLARYEQALARPCPRCKARPGVWCGPVLTRAVTGPVEPWMHDSRFPDGAA